MPVKAFDILVFSVCHLLKVLSSVQQEKSSILHQIHIGCILCLFYFKPQHIPVEAYHFAHILNKQSKTIKVKALFSKDVKWRLVEEFGPNCFTETEDGRLMFTADYTDSDNLITWIMTFGNKAEVLEPVEARRQISKMVQKMATIYKED